MINIKTIKDLLDENDPLLSHIQEKTGIGFATPRGNMLDPEGYDDDKERMESAKPLPRFEEVGGGVIFRDPEDEIKYKNKPQ